MARAFYTCAECPAQIRVVGYNRKDADGKVAYFTRIKALCAACQAKAFAAQNVEAIETSRDIGLPDLRGSDKQIEWASTLRLAMIEKIKTAATDLKAQIEASKFEVELKLENCDAVAFVAAEMLENSSAKFWIENRTKDYKYLIKQEILGRADVLTPLSTAFFAARKNG